MFTSPTVPQGAVQTEETTMSTPTNNTVLSAPPAFGGGWKLAACASLSLLITLFAASVINHSVVTRPALQPTVAVYSAAPLPTVTVVAKR